MSSNWPILKIEDVAERVGMGPFGSSIKVETFVDSGVPVISGEHLHDITLTEKKFRFITEKHAEQLAKSNVFRGDVVFTHAGTIGQVSVVPENSKYEKYIISQRQFFMRCNRELVNPLYVAYFFKSPQGRHKLLANASQVGVPSIARPVTYLRSIEIPIPSLALQNRIVEIIESIRDRITLLRETNKTLEAIAQALFKSWFVDFDPVRAKMEGRQPEGMDEATAALFPDSFEESELGEIPKGWSVLKFGEFIERLSVGKKFDQKTALVEGLVPILDQGKSGMIGFHNETPGVNASLDSPVVVFANHTCYMRLICFDFSAIQNVLPFVGKGVDTVWAFFATRDRVKFTEYKGHWPDFAIEKAVVPLKSLTDSFRSAVNPLIRRIRINELQTETLSNLRDTLLPRLISGQLRLPEAEAEIEALTA
jgi:type I restriction enzyme S subunit